MKKMLILLIIAVIGFTSCSPNKKEEPRYQHSSITQVQECTTLKVIEGSAIQKKKIMLTKSEQLILATLIRLECGGSSFETKCAVASVVINRMKMWNLTLRGVVFQPNVFSPARLIDKETGRSYYNPSREGAYSECWKAVGYVCENGSTLPYYVIYFRAGYYHKWCTPYAKIGSLYFSYSSKYM